jgi:hypothetical protein
MTNTKLQKLEVKKAEVVKDNDNWLEKEQAYHALKALADNTIVAIIKKFISENKTMEEDLT